MRRTGRQGRGRAEPSRCGPGCSEPSRVIAGSIPFCRIGFLNPLFSWTSMDNRNAAGKSRTTINAFSGESQRAGKIAAENRSGEKGIVCSPSHPIFPSCALMPSCAGAALWRLAGVCRLRRASRPRGALARHLWRSQERSPKDSLSLVPCHPVAVAENRAGRLKSGAIPQAKISRTGNTPHGYQRIPPPGTRL